MKLYKEESGKLVPLSADIIDDKKERDIERLILSQPQILGEDLLFIGEQATFPELAGDAIDLVALDSAGRLVVIELKRGTTPSDTDFQLLKYAGYAHGLTVDDLARRATSFLSRTENKWYHDSLVQQGVLQDGSLEKLDLPRALALKFKSTGEPLDESSINNAQRLILLAERFDRRIASVLVWLHRQDVDIQGYVYERFTTPVGTLFAIDRIIPTRDVAAELSSAARRDRDEPWKRNGRKWHLEVYPYTENLPILVELIQKLEALPGTTIRWEQKLYLKIYGSTGRELRVYTRTFTGRVDLLFMGARPAELTDLLGRHGTKQRESKSYAWGGSQWVAIGSVVEAGNSNILESVREWLFGPEAAKPRRHQRATGKSSARRARSKS